MEVHDLTLGQGRVSFVALVWGSALLVVGLGLERILVDHTDWQVVVVDLSQRVCPNQLRVAAVDLVAELVARKSPIEVLEAQQHR